MVLRVIGGAALLTLFALPSFARHQAEQNTMEMDGNASMDAGANAMGSDTAMTNVYRSRHYLLGMTGEGAGTTALFVDAESVTRSGTNVRARVAVWGGPTDPGAPAGRRWEEELVEAECDRNVMRTLSWTDHGRDGRMLRTEVASSPAWTPVEPESMGSVSLRFLCGGERDSFLGVDDVAATAQQMLADAGYASPSPARRARAAPRHRGR
jgi:hypothetical protein